MTIYDFWYSLQEILFYYQLMFLNDFHMLEELRHDLGSDYTTIATGGQAPLVVGDVGMFDIIDTDLTLRGLLLIEKAFGRSI